MIDHRIQTFLTLYDTMNYRETAQLLLMTQPAVTQHIQHLEREFGCRLFSYDGRKLERTPEAEILRRYADSMLYQERKLRSALQPSAGLSIAMGATKTIGEYALYDHAARFLARPENRLSMEVDNTIQILDMLRRGALDFALVEGFFPRSEFGSFLYRREPFTGLCSDDHPFAGRTVRLEELWSEHLICREADSGTRAILEQVLAEQNHTLSDFRRVTCIGNFGLLARLVEAGTGITFSYVAVGEGHPELRRFAVDGWNIVREFNYVYLPDTDGEQLAKAFESYRIANP